MASKKADMATAVHDPHHNPPTESKAVETVTAAFGDAVTVAPTPSTVSRFQSLVGDADVVAGGTLEKEKDNLIGMPFVITSITIRDGLRSAKTNNITNYVSLEAVIADRPTMAKALQRGLINQGQANLFDPEESIVINDGSTGICRQVIAWAHSKGYINVPEGPETGGAGETRYDAYWGTWADNNTGEAGSYRIELDRPLYCPRGLRLSTYENDYSPDGATYYLG